MTSFSNKYVGDDSLTNATEVVLPGSKDLQSIDKIRLPVTAETNADAPDPSVPTSETWKRFPTLN